MKREFLQKTLVLSLVALLIVPDIALAALIEGPTPQSSGIQSSGIQQRVNDYNEQEAVRQALDGTDTSGNSFGPFGPPANTGGVPSPSDIVPLGRAPGTGPILVPSVDDVVTEGPSFFSDPFGSIGSFFQSFFGGGTSPNVDSFGPKIDEALGGQGFQGNILTDPLGTIGNFFTGTLPSAIGDVFGAVGSGVQTLIGWGGDAISGIGDFFGFGGGAELPIDTGIGLPTGTGIENYFGLTDSYGTGIDTSGFYDTGFAVEGDLYGGFADSAFDASGFTDAGGFAIGETYGDSIGSFTDAGGFAVEGDLYGSVAPGGDWINPDTGLPGAPLGEIPGLGSILGIAGGLLGGNEVPVNDKKVRSNTKGILRDTTSLNRKDTILDGIAYAIEKTLIRAITQSVVDWINSGFQGNPAFVTDLEGFLLDVGDRAAGAYIYGSDLAFLCSPFKLQIQISLLTSRSRQRVKCRLSDVVGNIQGFLTDSNVRLQTLDQWTTLTSDPFSNPYGAYVATQATLDARVAGARFIEGKKLDFGRGFLNFTQETNCQMYPASRAPAGNTGRSVTGVGDGSAVRVCDVVTQTPGSVIEQQLNNVLGSGQRQLELADEFNEIISALMGQVAKQALTGAGGLLGLSRSGSAGRPSYTSQLRASADPALAASRDALRNAMQSSISLEEDYRNTSEQTKAFMLHSKELVEDIADCYNEKAISETLLAADKATAASRAAVASTTAVSLTPRITDLDNQILRADLDINALEQLDAITKSAVSADTLSQVANEYSRLVIGHFIHDDNDLLDAREARENIQAEMNALDLQTAAQLSECQNFPPPPTTP